MASRCWENKGVGGPHNSICCDRYLDVVESRIRSSVSGSWFSGRNVSFKHTISLGSRCRSIHVLRDIEPPEDHDCFLATISVCRIELRVLWVCEALVNPKDTPASSKSLICAAIEHSFDTHLTECRSTHDTWFDGDIECCISERVCSTCQ